MLWAPVKYDAQTFLLRLLKELCIDVISTGSPRSRGYSSILVTGSRRRLITINIVASGLIVLGMALVAVKATATNIRPAVPFIVGGALIIIGGVAVYATRKQRSPRRRRDVGITQEIIDRAAELRTRVEFTETYTRNSQLGISGRGLSMSATEGAQLARIPLNEIDVVRELINLIKGINGWQVVIAIDELDKMQSDTEAIEFLNHVKVLFPIQGCSFIVSVSENAWARFENRGIPFSDAFDSSFDEIVHVQMLRPHESRDLLKRRNPNISDSQALLCHCLSGGLPRDLLRATRLLARVATQLRKDGETEPPRLSKVLDVLLVEDLSEKIEAFKVQTRNTENRTESNLDAITIWPQVWPDLKETEHWLGCVRANHDNNRVASLSERSPQYAEFQAYIAVLHTIRQAFSSKGPLTELEKESNFDNDLIGLGFDRIARARRCLATDVDSTWRLLDGARETLKLELIRAVSDE